MKMRLILIAILFPLFSMSQTVHLKKDDIEYKGSLKTADNKNYAEADVTAALTDAIEQMKKTTSEGTGLKRKAEITLNTPYQLIRKVKFDIDLSVNDKSVDYKIDKFIMEEKKRDGEFESTSGEDLVSDMGESGKPAIEAERILNEIDMRIQQLLALISKELPKENK